MSQPVRSSALNFSSPWLVETPESFVILDAADAWVFLSPAAPIFVWGIWTHDGSSFIHVTCVTCPVVGEIAIRQAQAQVQKLIQRMARENPTWGEERIAAELLLKLHIRVSPRTVRRYMPLDTGPRKRVPSQRWMTFVRNHAQAIVACDFFMITKLWPRRSWVDSITNTFWKDVRLDLPEEKCS